MSVGATPTREEISAKIQAAMGGAYTVVAELTGKLDGIIIQQHHLSNENKQIRDDIKWYQMMTLAAIGLATVILMCLTLIEVHR
jgi:hypothetical protein